jgi:hypothetical protein
MIIENVTELRMSMIKLLYGKHWFIQELIVDSGDSGHDGMNRLRLYLILWWKGRVIEEYSIMDTYCAVTRQIKSMVATQPKDYMVSCRAELLMEASQVAFSRGKRLRSTVPGKPLDFTYLLNARERAAISHCKQKTVQEDANLFIYLVDSQKQGFLTWSGGGRIPTFRCKNAKMYHPASRTWLSNRSKLAALGMPVTPECALAMGVPIMPCSDTARAGQMAGNSFHFSSAAIVQLVALSCLRVLENN